MEKLEVFDKRGNYTGKILDRETIHKKGLWHRVVHVWIYNDNGEVLIQKRSAKKDAHPGLWDISAAGHIDIGETPETAVIREAKEELGINLERDKLEFFDIKNIILKDERNGILDKEITYIYLYKYDIDGKNFKIDPEEVTKIKFINISKLKEKLKDANTNMHFVPFNDSYYEPIMEYISKITISKDG